MRLLRYTFAVLLFASALPLYAQVEGRVQPDNYAVVEQAGSPLGIVIRPESMAPSTAGQASAYLKNVVYMRNLSSKTVRGYVLIARSGDKDISYTCFILRGHIEPGRFRPQVFRWDALIDDKADNIELLIDYVSFTDGSEWGQNTLGRSKVIPNYIKGFGAAKAKLAELVNDTNSADFLTQVDTFVEMQVTGPGHPIVPSADKRDYFAVGFEKVIDILSRMEKRRDEAIELARKLELIEKTFP